LLLLSWEVSSAPGRAEIIIKHPPEINIYEPLIRAVVFVESGGNNMAIGTHHDTGPFQITPIRIKDYNQRTKSNYKLEDCYDYTLSRKIFLYYTKGRSYEVVAKCWNGWTIKQSTQKYWEKVRYNL
jgi:hypothetical protein